MKLLRWILVGALGLALAGCESAPVKDFTKSVSDLVKGGGGNKGDQELAAGIRQYEDGNYSEAARLLQASLDQGIFSISGQVTAHKYLAFIHCISGREAQCRNEFRAALKVDPTFDLAPNEAGHPIWGPVFRSVKGRK